MTPAALFGENRPQEMDAKRQQLPADIEWHMIGHLQTNKVKLIAPYVSMIHSVDSAKLLGVINEQALKNNRVIDVLFEVHVAREESKHGWNEGELIAYLARWRVSSDAGGPVPGFDGSGDLHGRWIGGS